MSYKVHNGVLIPASFAEERPVKPIYEEVATTADGRDITRGFVDGLQLLPPTDSIQQLRGVDLRVYDEVRRDDQVATVLQQRKLALSSKEWTAEAGGTKRADKAAADFIREQLNHIPFDRLTEKMLSGLFWGYAVAECLWARDGRFIALANVKVKKQRRFGFAPDGSLRLLTAKAPQGEELPARKFWAYATGADDDDDPYGMGLAHWLYWPTFFKRNGIKFWLIFLEKFGMPTAVGKYPTSASPEEKNKLLQALRAIQMDSGIRIPDTMQIDLLEAARSGTADYTALYDRMNQAISKVVLGHAGSSDSTPGRLGGEDMASEVRGDLIKADADLICSSFNLSVVKWLTDWNFPNAAPPRVWREVDEPEDLQARADRDKVIFDMGYKPTLQYISETYDGEFEAKPDANPNTSANDQVALVTSLPARPDNAGRKASDPAAQFAEARQLDDPPGEMVDLLERAAQPAVDGMMEAVRGVLHSSTDLLEVRGRLAGLFPALDKGALAAVFAEAFLAADLAGRGDVSEGR
jgi:phage gp29-like protein